MGLEKAASAGELKNPVGDPPMPAATDAAKGPSNSTLGWIGFAKDGIGAISDANSARNKQVLASKQAVLTQSTNQNAQILASFGLDGARTG